MSENNKQSLRSLSDSVSDGSKGVGALIGYLWQEMCELPDRSSPEEYPDMALVTLDELTAIVDTFFERQRLRALDSGMSGRQPAAMKPFVYGLRDIRDGMPHFDEMCISADRSDLEEHIEGDESLEVVPLYSSPTEPKAGVVSEDIIDAARNLLAAKFSTYKARNGRDVGVEDDNGEKCWIVPFDEVFALETALAAEGREDE